jgi:hypothetical protein
MAILLLQPVDRPHVPPRPISERLRTQLIYFAAQPGAEGIPALGEAEYFLTKAEVDRTLDEGVVYLVSPLDTAGMTEVEITEEQEQLLQWLHDQGVQHVRVVERG